MNIHIDIIDERLIHFETINTEPGSDVNNPATIGVEYDVEPGTPGEWLLYIDLRYKQENVLHIETRTSFKIAASFEILWQKGVADGYIGAALSSLKLSLLNMLPVEFKESAAYTAINHSKNIDIVYNMLMEDVERNQVYSGDDPSVYEGKIGLQPGGNYNIICSITLCVFDEIFYLSPYFNKEKNIRTFEQYLPLRYYTTVKVKLIQLMNNEPVELNIKQLTMFLFMVRCSCSLLLTEHFDNLWPGLQAKGATQTAIDNYIKVASGFLTDINASLQQANVNILNLEEEVDWVALVS